jgi:formyltetrahydrofolate deformylase
MLTYGATVHFIVPELDAGEQIIHQDTFTAPPGTPLAEIVRRGSGSTSRAAWSRGCAGWWAGRWNCTTTRW